MVIRYSEAFIEQALFKGRAQKSTATPWRGQGVGMEKTEKQYMQLGAEERATTSLTR